MEGTPFGRYRLVEVLGRGGMGEVWRGFDTVTERTVAVKVLPAHLAGDEGFQQRFLREAKAAASLNEPHVVPIYDFGEINDRLFVAMRLVDGHDLQTLLADGPLAPDRAVAIIEQVASALQAAHGIGLVHRDVKPSNVLVGEDDFAYLIDFGIARLAGETGLTSTGMTLGTWPYMAPERFRTGTADARSDVYALTCVLHQALTGQQPFPGESLEQIATGHMFDPPPRPSAIRGSVPAALDDVIATGMAKDPDERYATARELAQAARRAALPATVSHATIAAAGAATLAAPAPELNYVPTQVAPASAVLDGAPSERPDQVQELDEQRAETRRSRWAISSFILGLIGGIGVGFGPPGWVFYAFTAVALAGVAFGVVALANIRQTHQRGRWLAVSGAAFGAIWLLFAVFVGLTVSPGLPSGHSDSYKTGYHDGSDPTFLDELINEGGMSPEKICRDSLDARQDVKLGGDPKIDSGDYMQGCLDGIRDARRPAAGHSTSAAPSTHTSHPANEADRRPVPAQPAPPDPDVVFVQRLIDAGLTIKDRAGVIQMGHNVCDYLGDHSKQQTIDDMYRDQEERWDKPSKEKVAAMVESSIAVYCPQYSGR
ncbi:protein kinase domain-containing protein [Mycolicibacter algericus]|uniref:non-specific serine/threonine protein kinase n=1 Tax=Mycolicibacter algericus TaxID=1288388 RepID=A0A7I9Y6L6_MYCAL|nr:protein kinase [Mycolicibacter algericus]GFG84329.1 hypothetical protein MALGJ_10050 [Mycolicibacter algericus]